MSVFLHIVPCRGLAHLSYLIGQGGQAAVIDPKRDSCQDYVNLAHAQGARITHILETHRNEDYVIGSVNLARLTGATIYHGAGLDFAYGRTAHEGDAFKIGNLTLKALSTPGHTMESLSYAVYDTKAGDSAVAVFTGDALFIGDVGRTDLFPDQAEEVAAMLYDGIHNKLLPLGDQTIIYPAHGAGSVCGSAISEREFSTLGHERKHNPRLQLSREEFIRFKSTEAHYVPAYFRKMEEYNQHGNAPALDCVATPPPINADEFAQAMKDGAQVLDLRNAEAFAGAYIPGSLSIQMNMLQSFTGFFNSYDRDIILVLDQNDQAQSAASQLSQIGYDRVAGFLADGMVTWEASSRHYDSIPLVHVSELVRRIDASEDFTLLDVRSAVEWEDGILPGATTIYVGELPKHLDQVPRDKPVVCFCGTGQRAIIAASLLKQNGYTQVENCMGSMLACQSYGCPLSMLEE